MTDPFASRPTTLADYVAIVRRRKWIIVLPLLVAPAMAVMLSSEQPSLYRASAEIYVKRADKTDRTFTGYANEILTPNTAVIINYSVAYRK